MAQQDPIRRRVTLRVGLGCLYIACFTTTLIGQRRRPTAPDPTTRFVEMLASEDARQQWQAVRGLTALGERAVEALLTVLRRPATGSRPVATRALAAHALARMEHKAVSAIPDLIAMLRSGTPQHRMVTITVLGYVAPFDEQQASKARGAIVRELCSKPETMQRKYAIAGPALARLAVEPEITTAALLTRLHSRDSTHRIQAAQWLTRRERTKTDKQHIIRHLRAAVVERQPRNSAFAYRWKTSVHDRVVYTHRPAVVRQELAQCLLRVTKDLPVAAWLALLDHRDPVVRQESALALGSSGENEVVPALIAALEDRDRIVTWEAITALGMIGPPASSARGALEAMAAGTDKGIAVRAKAALRRIRGS